MRWRDWFRRSPGDAEIDEEIRAHLEMATRERMERGESEEVARRSAALELGNAGLVKEDTRGVWVRAAREAVAQDFRYALRRLRKSPGFTLVAVLTLAFGLSANATIFSLVSTMFLRPLPVQDAESMVVLLRKQAGSAFFGGVSWSDYRDYRAEVGEFRDALALAFRPAHVSVDGHAPDRTWIEAVSGNYFSMLGVTPTAGRLFAQGEGETAGADPVAVLAYDYWQSRLGGDRRVIGREAVINGRSLTIVGVARKGFSSAQWSIAPSAFVPATMMPELFPGNESILVDRDSGAFRVMAQLKPGARAEEAESAAQVVGQRLDERYRPDGKKSRVVVRPERLTRPQPSFSGFVPFAIAIFGAMAALVLFIACANVANLMFSRALDRRREIGIRSAIGARRRRLIGQLLTESVVLGLLAGAAGLALSHAAGLALARMSAISGDVPIRANESGDWLPAVATMLLSVAVGAVTGLFPALRATRVDPLAVIKGGAPGLAEGRQTFRSGLVLSQVAVAVVVLACAGLFVRSLASLEASELGFRTERLAMASLDLRLQGYDRDRGLRFLEELTESVRALPGVESAAIGSSVPFDTQMTTRAVAPADEAGAGDDGEASALKAGLNRIDAAYFEALGVTLLRGRELDARDRDSSARVAVVNETFARRLWPDEDALGRRFRWKTGGDPIEVVGVAADGKYLMLGEAPRPFVYLPIPQEYSAPVTLHVRTKTEDALALAPALREAIRELDPDLPVFDVRTMDEHLRQSAFAYLPIRMAATVAGAQGLVALLLAVMGVYGVVASSVSRRTRDIGIRVVLGARGLDVFRMVSGAALRPALLGLGLGLAAALGLARFLTALLYGLDPADAPVFGAVGALMLGVSLLACWVPARRALRIEPIAALRQE